MTTGPWSAEVPAMVEILDHGSEVATKRERRGDEQSEGHGLHHGGAKTDRVRAATTMAATARKRKSGAISGSNKVQEDRCPGGT